MEIERAIKILDQARIPEGTPEMEAVRTIATGYFNLRNEKEKLISTLENYAEQLRHEDLLSETGKWVANRIILECIKIVKKEKEKTE